MSESITHTAVVDDALRFVGFFGEFSPPFKAAAGRQKDLARLGGITRHGDKHTPMLLEKARRVFMDKKADDSDLAKLGFVIGWLSHRATDRQFKRIFREVDPDCPREPTDCSVYHDAHLFRVLYEGGRKEPYDRSTLRAKMEGHPADGVMDVALVEDLFKGMWRRMLIEMHTFIPDDEDIETWLDRVAATNQRLYVDLSRYAEAFADTSSDRYQRFIIGINFYDPTDAILEAASRLRNSESSTIDPKDNGARFATLGELVSPDGSTRQYAQALARAVRYIQAADAFFSFRIEKDELLDRLDIGKPELEKVE